MSKLRDEILARHDPRVRRRAELEYAVICAVMRECAKGGFVLDSVAWDEYTPTPTRESALRLIFDLDECTLRFRRRKVDGPAGNLYGVFLVMGNDGWDVVSDYTYDAPEGCDMDKPPPGTFAACVEAATRPFADKYG